MYLLVGDQDDQSLVALLAAIRGSGSEAELVSGVFSQPARLTWIFDSSSSRTRFLLENGRHLNDEEIEGVVVRRARAVKSTGWRAEDYFFVEAEHQAALIGWLWSLRCHVINRLPAAVWFNGRLSLAFWDSALRQSGLPPVDSLLSNVEQDVRAFCRENRGAVYAPLTGDGHYPIENDASLADVVTLQTQFPVYLTPPYEELHSACIVGQEVIWPVEPPSALREVESALTRFAATAKLSCCEVSMLPTAHGPRVMAVNPEPNLAKYRLPSQLRIIDGLVGLLSGRNAPSFDHFPANAEMS